MEGDYNYICGGSSVEKVVLFSTRVKSAQCTRKVVPAYSKTALGEGEEWRYSLANRTLPWYPLNRGHDESTTIFDAL